MNHYLLAENKPKINLPRVLSRWNHSELQLTLPMSCCTELSTLGILLLFLSLFRSNFIEIKSFLLILNSLISFPCRIFSVSHLELLEILQGQFDIKIFWTAGWTPPYMWAVTTVWLCWSADYVKKSCHWLHENKQTIRSCGVWSKAGDKNHNSFPFSCFWYWSQIT